MHWYGTGPLFVRTWRSASVVFGVSVAGGLIFGVVQGLGVIPTLVGALLGAFMTATIWLTAPRSVLARFVQRDRGADPYGRPGTYGPPAPYGQPGPYGQAPYGPPLPYGQAPYGQPVPNRQPGWYRDRGPAGEPSPGEEMFNAWWRSYAIPAFLILVAIGVLVVLPTIVFVLTSL